MTPTIFVIFVGFWGLRINTPCFCGSNVKSSFSPFFNQNNVLSARDNNTVSKNTVSTILTNGRSCMVTIVVVRGENDGTGERSAEKLLWGSRAKSACSLGKVEPGNVYILDFQQQSEKSTLWTNTGVHPNFQRDFEPIGPYEILGKSVWTTPLVSCFQGKSVCTNGPERSSKVSPEHCKINSGQEFLNQI